jgi:hypothetical protein
LSVNVDTLIDLVFGAKLFSALVRRIVGTLNVADANPATVLRLGYHFGDCAVRKANAITNLQVIQVHASPRSVPRQLGLCQVSRNKSYACHRRPLCRDLVGDEEGLNVISAMRRSNVSYGRGYRRR